VELKRISLMLREDQYGTLAKKGLNLSGLVRDLLDDHLSEYKITLSVSKETKDLYDQIVANTGSSDDHLESYLRTALREMLGDKIEEMRKLHQSLD
jgi:hypothetical protein